jgi:hypothetical protein
MLSKNDFIGLSYRNVLILILVINLASRLFLVSKPLPLLDGKLLPDDPYLCWSISKSIAEGKGPLYDGNFTNGFQPLYVFTTVPFFYFFQGDQIIPIKLSLILLSLFDTATLLVLLLWIRSITANLLITSLSAFFWIFNDYVIRTSLNGMETIMASFFLVWACYYYYRLYFIETERSPTQLFRLGIIIGFACFTRVDSGMLAIIMGLSILYNERADLRKMVIKGACFGIGAFIIFSIWMIYSTYYTGSWYPESGKAIRLISLSGSENVPAWKFYKDLIYFALYLEIKENGTLIFMIAAFALYVFPRRNFTFKSLLPANNLFLFSAIIFFAYVFYIFTAWYFDRYFFPFTILFILLTAILLKEVVSNLPAKFTPYLYGVLVILWLVTLGWKERYQDYYAGPEDKTLGYMNLGLWANNNLPKGSVVGSSQSGALDYFATNITVLNLDGVVNKKTFNSLLEKRNMEYIKENKVDYVVGWDLNIDFIKQNSKNFKESDLLFVKKIEGFQSWGRDWYLYKVNR